MNRRNFLYLFLIPKHSWGLAAVDLHVDFHTHISHGFLIQPLDMTHPQISTLSLYALWLPKSNDIKLQNSSEK